MADIVIDPAVPEGARRELEQTSLSALLGFNDPVAHAEAGVPDDDDAPVRQPAVRAAAGAIAAVMAVLLAAGVGTAGPFAPDLVFLALLISLPFAAAGGLHLLHRAKGSVPELAGSRPWIPERAALTYRGQYVVPALDLEGEPLAQWRRASQAARAISASDSVRLGLINSVEVAAVLPYHLWDVAERLALLSGTERRQAALLRDLDVEDPDVQVVLGPQRRARDLAVADIERRIARLADFAELAAAADAARRRQRAIADLAGLNADYEELLIRLGDTDDALTGAGRPAGELREMTAVAQDAVRRANDAGRALLLPAPDHDGGDRNG